MGDYLNQIESHRERLVGWFCARVGVRDTANELSQRTWVEVLDRLETFNPDLGTFWVFTKNWADIVLARHRHEVARDRQREPHFPDGDPDAFGGCSMTSAALIAAARRYDQLLDATCHCKRLPHEILSFSLVKLCEWTPRGVVDRVWSSTLDELLEIFERESALKLASPTASAAFAHLRLRLARPLREENLDARIMKPVANLSFRVSGTTLLADYGRDDRTPERSVVRWWSAVDRVVRADLIRADDGPVAEWLRGLRREE